MAKPTPASPAKAGRTLDDFRAAHDKNYIVPNKIRTALSKLGDGWEYEVDFIRLASTSTTDLAMFRDQFAEHIVETGGRNGKRVWVGSAAAAKKMREMVS